MTRIACRFVINVLDIIYFKDTDVSKIHETHNFQDMPEIQRFLTLLKKSQNQKTHWDNIENRFYYRVSGIPTERSQKRNRTVQNFRAAGQDETIAS
ncbi:hypothetical protein AVEN_253730-1 [Araneus ventricosus]|uniref:Uncharacterized protein n=1 Tax=Araneus ventricosus TaxID=182803 RepID=A0A4Y2DVQ0_ARAVE|nr:hypothetical protein AVEN_253730-1 [Araneus ventricosus]